MKENSNEKKNIILKRHYESLPKQYKEYREKTLKDLLRTMENCKSMRKEVNIFHEEIPKMFLLFEEQLNLPDMTAEELKIIFPYFFEGILREKYF